MPAPIALFVYNRPEHTRRTVEALARNHGARDSDLFVFADAPKSPHAAPDVDAVRRYLRTIDGFRSIELIERDRNWGVDASVIDGVTTLCEQRGTAIVVEDDLVTSPWFLDYMDGALARYRDEPRVMQVAGHMFPIAKSAGADASFLPSITSWGWATWQRAWKRFDPTASGYDRLKSDARRRRAFDLDDSYPYFAMLQQFMDGALDAWDIRWYLSVFDSDGLALYPKRSLVHNIGFDGTGVHCPPSSFAGTDVATEPVRRFPPVMVDSTTMKVFQHYLRSQLPTRRRAFAKLVSRVAAFDFSRHGRVPPRSVER